MLQVCCHPPIGMGDACDLRDLPPESGERGCHKGVTRMLQGCYNGATRVLERCHKGVTRASQERCKHVTRALQASLQGCYHPPIGMGGVCAIVDIPPEPGKCVTPKAEQSSSV
jgi:hypothetical protein